MKFELIKQINIKDLAIFQYPEVIKLIEKDIYDSYSKGINIGEITVNTYIYETKSTDIYFMMRYIKTLNGLAEVFRELYDNLIYTLRLEKMIGSDIYNDNTNFQFIFNAINNSFNMIINDRYLFEDFCIYFSDTSLNTCIELYDTFTYNFISLLCGTVDANILKSLCMNKNIFNISQLYAKIYQQFEYIIYDFISD